MTRNFFLKIFPALFAGKEIAEKISPAPQKGFVFPMPERVDPVPEVSDIWALLDKNFKPIEEVYVTAVDPYRKGDPFECEVFKVSYGTHEPKKVISLKNYRKVSSVIGEFDPDRVAPEPKVGDPMPGRQIKKPAVKKEMFPAYRDMYVKFDETDTVAHWVLVDKINPHNSKNQLECLVIVLHDSSWPKEHRNDFQKFLTLQQEKKIVDLTDYYKLYDGYGNPVYPE